MYRYCMISKNIMPLTGLVCASFCGVYVCVLNFLYLFFLSIISCSVKQKDSLIVIHTWSYFLLNTLNWIQWLMTTVYSISHSLLSVWHSCVNSEASLVEGQSFYLTHTVTKLEYKAIHSYHSWLFITLFTSLHLFSLSSWLLMSWWDQWTSSSYFSHVESCLRLCHKNNWGQRNSTLNIVLQRDESFSWMMLAMRSRIY